MNTSKSKGSRQALVQLLIGIALISSADSLNKAGQVNWGTVFIYFVGLVCIVSAAIDYFSPKK